MNFYFDCINRTTMSFILKYFIPAIILLCSCDQIVTKSVEVPTTTTTIVYTVEFNAGDGSGAAKQYTLAGDEELIIPECDYTPPVGKKFGGWLYFTTSEDVQYLIYQPGDKVSSLADRSGAAAVLTAVWLDQDVYILTYRSATPDDQTIRSAEFRISDTVILSNASADYYIFDGWWTSADGNAGSRIYGWRAGEMTSDVTVWGRWTQISYTVQFHANGGTGSMQDISFVTDEEKSLPACTIVPPTGMKFGSWNTKQDGSGTGYGDQQSVVNITSDKNAVLFAQWIDQNAHTISYRGLKSGDNTANPLTFRESENVTIRRIGNIPGYTFGGWTDAQAGGREITGWYAGEMTSDAILWAKWEPVRYTVTFDGCGGIGSMAAADMTYDAAASLPANTFTRHGYTFSGWSRSQTGISESYIDGQSVTNLADGDGDVVTLYAIWQPYRYTVMYQGNGGAGAMDYQIMMYDCSADLNRNAFTRTGYTFCGWSLSDTGAAIAYTDGECVRNLTDSNMSIITVYAVWKPNVYNVRYNANGGSGTMANQTITYDVPTNLSANAFTRTGYTFRGWNISSTASTATYTDRQSVSNLHAADNYTVDLYAIWKANSYTVAFNANGGTGTMSNLAMTYGTAKALTANAFTRTGYTFAGWATTNNATSATYTNKQKVSNLTAVSGSTVTLYAVWTPKSFTITYKNVGGGAYTGNNSSSLPATHTYGTATVIPTGKSDSGTFLGWYTSSDGMSEPISVLGETAYTANITLYAQWTGTITLNHDGGTSSQSSLDINTGEKKVVTPPTKTNYVFQGYYTERLGKGTKYFDANGKFTKAWDLGGKTTLYAGWKYKAMNNFNAVWSEDDIACSWTNPEKTYTISVLYSNVSIYSSTTGGATSGTIRDNVLDWNKANGKSDGYLTVKSYYLDSNSIDGKGIEVSIKLPKCLRFVGTSSFSITANNGKTWDGVLQYSTNGTSWTEWDGSIIESGLSKFVYIRGKNNSIITGNNSLSISSSGEIYCYGNIEYLLHYETADSDFHPNMSNYCYSSMFSGCTSLTTAPTLPATTLAEYCYHGMFSGCKNLTTAPTLPATTLANNCYSNMFSGCTSLITAPTLPATTLAGYCYRDMFSGCKSLTTAPVLSATTLAKLCYCGMFSGCTSLTTAPTLPATTLAEYCYYSMFSGCKNLTTAPTLPATTLAERCYYQMFSGCTSLTTAPPILPATTLAEDCYYSMFSGCTSLTTAPTLPATTLAEDCYHSMFSGCTSLITAPTLPATTLASWCYDNMFKGCTSLTTAPPILPATTLAKSCYYEMFSGCTSLTTAPILPATTLAENCYSRMFSYCTSLSTAPSLPATTLASWCYNNMFLGCKNLTTAPPILPATTLAFDCYDSMFKGCTSLTTAPTLPATTLASSCYSNMFSGCKNLTTAPTLPATTLASSCYSSMFSGCTSLTTAPTLPATTLAENCYDGMFLGCKNLTTAPTLPATTLASWCYYNMFSGCTSLITAPTLPATTLAERCYYQMFSGCTSLTLRTSVASGYQKFFTVPSYTVTYPVDNMFRNCNIISGNETPLAGETYYYKK